MELRGGTHLGELGQREDGDGRRALVGARILLERRRPQHRPPRRPRRVRAALGTREHASQQRLAARRVAPPVVVVRSTLAGLRGALGEDEAARRDLKAEHPPFDLGGAFGGELERIAARRQRAAVGTAEEEGVTPAAAIASSTTRPRTVSADFGFRALPPPSAGPS